MRKKLQTHEKLLIWKCWCLKKWWWTMLMWPLCFSASKEICCKKRFWHFFENYRKSMFRSKISSWNHSESKEHIRNIFPSYSYERRISKNEKSFMHILLAFFKLIFMPNSLIKSLRKKIHFFRIEFSTSIFQAYFGCALSIPNDFRTIFWI